MERLNKIINSSEFNDIIKEIAVCEKDRIFCNHSLQHFIDTARICYILVLEDRIQNGVEMAAPLSMEIVYAAGMLHDIGRLEQYRAGVDHAEEGARIAEKMLRGAGFTKSEREIITTAIKEHRRIPDNPSYLGEKLYKADKLSRPCYNCEAADGCYRMRSRHLQQLGR